MTGKKSPEKAEKTVAAKDIFLATLGLYGKIYEQGTDLSSQISDKTQHVFNDLVSRGEKLERQAKKKYSQLKIEDRIENIRNNFAKNKGYFSKKNAERSQIAA